MFFNDQTGKSDLEHLPRHVLTTVGSRRRVDQLLRQRSFPCIWVVPSVKVHAALKANGVIDDFLSFSVRGNDFIGGDGKKKGLRYSESAQLS
jgi:hypothetical protein